MIRNKALCFCAAAALLLGLCGCGEEKEPPVTLAVVTDGSSALEQGVNQAVWQAVQTYAEESGEKTGRYHPANGSGEACGAAIDEAVEKGAQVVISCGEGAGTAVYQAQREYRNVQFLMLGAEPHKDGSDKAKLRGNTRCILFDREQAGFLAGYAAVKEGYTNLAYYGGKDQERAKEYGVGFLEGAQEAAKELKLGDGAVQIRYQERGTDGVSPEFLSEMEQNYQSGCQAVFTDGSSFTAMIQKAAEAVGGKVLGAETDQSQASSAAVISAVNQYGEVLTQELKAIAQGDFDGGKTETLGISEGGVGLTMGTSQMVNFTQEQYSQLLEKAENEEFRFQGTQLLKKTDSFSCLQIQREE